MAIKQISNLLFSDQTPNYIPTIVNLTTIPSLPPPPPPLYPTIPKRRNSYSPESMEVFARPSFSSTLPLPRSKSRSSSETGFLEKEYVKVEELNDKSETYLDYNKGMDDNIEPFSGISKQPLLDFSRITEIEEYLSK